MSRHFYPSPTFAVSEIDGIRIFSSDTCDFIQKVPSAFSVCWLPSRILTVVAEAALNLFLPGSTDPSAILYDAWSLFTQRSPRADETVRQIRPDLASAVDACIDVAGWEWNTKTQRLLLSVRDLKPLGSHLVDSSFRHPSMAERSLTCTTQPTLCSWARHSRF